uniref:Putative RNA dependent RNA polymerase n=1 Tax=Plasmopara viticola lesion associated totivirus-like 4 TaxID=2689139 RepID=A0A6B9HDC7_9VIRU|nr:putative RNA dependent RNA polymerase [Plasmopara viticola lesion associated totivirus-like 4]
MITERRPAGTFSNPALGIAEPMIPEIGEFEQEACGYVSGRSWVAAPPRSLAGETPLEVEYNEVGNIDDDEIDFDQDTRGCDLDVFGFAMKPMMLQERLSRSGFKCDLTNVIFATTKGVTRTTRNVGFKLERCDEIIKVGEKATSSDKTRLVVEPGYAAAFSVMTDEGVIKSRRSLTNAFPDPTNNMGEITEVCRHGRTLLTSSVETSRYVMRLAVMFVETVMATSGSTDRITWDVMQDPPYHALGSWAAFRPRVIQDAERNTEQNYVPWSKVAGLAMPQELTYYYVLKTAAADDARFLVNGVHIDPMCWPQIANLAIVSTSPISLRMQEDVAKELSAADIYAAARMWVFRYSKMQLFDDYVKFLMTMYWKKVGTDYVERLATSFPEASIELPKAQMRTFVMLPFLAGMDDTNSLINSVGTMDFLGKATETLSIAALTGMCCSWCNWETMDFAWSTGSVSMREQEQNLKYLRQVGGRVEIWDDVQGMLTKLGYHGKIGFLMAGVGCAASKDTYSAYVAAGATIRNTGDYLGMLPILPVGSAAMGYQNAQPLPKRACQADQAMLLSQVTRYCGTFAQACIAEQEEIEWFVQITDSRQSIVDTNAIQRPMRTGNGFSLDRGYLDYGTESGRTYRFGCVIGIRATYALGDPDDDRFSMKWWIRREPEENVRIIHLRGSRPDPDLGEAWYTPYGRRNARPGGYDNPPPFCGDAYGSLQEQTNQSNWPRRNYDDMNDRIDDEFPLYPYGEDQQEDSYQEDTRTSREGEVSEEQKENEMPENEQEEVNEPQSNSSDHESKIEDEDGNQHNPTRTGPEMTTAMILSSHSSFSGSTPSGTPPRSDTPTEQYPRMILTNQAQELVDRSSEDSVHEVLGSRQTLTPWDIDPETPFVPSVEPSPVPIVEPHTDNSHRQIPSGNVQSELQVQMPNVEQTSNITAHRISRTIPVERIPITEQQSSQPRERNRSRERALNVSSLVSMYERKNSQEEQKESDESGDAPSQENKPNRSIVPTAVDNTPVSEQEQLTESEQRRMEIDGVAMRILRAVRAARLAGDNRTDNDIITHHLEEMRYTPKERAIVADPNFRTQLEEMVPLMSPMTRSSNESEQLGELSTRDDDESIDNNSLILNDENQMPPTVEIEVSPTARSALGAIRRSGSVGNVIVSAVEEVARYGLSAAPSRTRNTLEGRRERRERRFRALNQREREEIERKRKAGERGRAGIGETSTAAESDEKNEEQLSRNQDDSAHNIV